MAGRMATDGAVVAHGGRVAVRRTDRAHRRSSWAERRTPSKVLAEHYGVSESRARHFRTDDQAGPLTTLLAMIADPNVDGSALMVAVLAAFEERFLYAPTPELRERLRFLREVEEHRLEAEQNRAQMIRDGKRTEACLNHAGVLIEIAVLEEMLGEEIAH